jgi:hypothetical protein
MAVPTTVASRAAMAIPVITPATISQRLLFETSTRAPAAALSCAGIPSMFFEL